MANKHSMITVGQTLYYIDTGGVIKEATVSKVGRKYFYISGSWRYEKRGFDLVTLKYTHPDYTQFSEQLYRSVDEINEIRERASLMDEVDKWFYQRRTKELSTRQLREIKNIIYAVEES